MLSGVCRECFQQKGGDAVGSNFCWETLRLVFVYLGDVLFTKSVNFVVEICNDVVRIKWCGDNTVELSLIYYVFLFAKTNLKLPKFLFK